MRVGVIGGSVAAVFLLFVLIGSAWRALSDARSDLLTAQSAAAAVAHDPNLLTSANGRQQLADDLNAMRQSSDNAANAVNNSFGLSVLSYVPFVGRQVDGATTLVNDTRTLTEQGQILLAQLQTTTKASSATDISIPALKTLDAQVHQSSTKIANLITPAAGLWGPIRGARTKFNTNVSYIAGLLEKGGNGLDYALPLLGADGPKTYFVAAENNSEMRDQGAVLSWALLHTNNGSYSIDDPQSVNTIKLENPAPFALPAGTQEVFGPLQPTQIWQSTNATADFPLSGAIMSSMYTKATRGGTVDGVVGVDVVALKQLLTLTGPVAVDGIPIAVTSNNIESLVLNRLYLKVPAGDQTSRRDELAAIASAVVGELKGSDVDVARLVKVLARATQGRHLLLYDANPAHEAVVTSFGASGSVSAVDPTGTFHLAIQSAVAAKLDYFIRSKVDYQVSVTSSGDALVSTTVSITNTAPLNARPSYALGPDHTNSFFPGQYVTRTYLWSPRGSKTPGGIDESGLVVDPTSATINPKETKVLTFQTVMPHAVRHGKLTLHFIPQGLLYAQPTTVTVTSPTQHLSGTLVKHWHTSNPETIVVNVAS